MPDPRIAMGYDVEGEVTGPYTIRDAKPGDPSQGGTLDRAIMAHTKDGRPVIIGEIWAMGIGKGESRIRIDAEAIAQGICDLLNATS